MKAKSILTFDTSVALYAAQASMGVSVPSGYVLVLNSVRILTDLTENVGTAQNSFDSNPVNLYAAVMHGLIPEVLNNPAHGLSYQDYKSMGWPVFEPVIRYHSDSEAYINTKVVADIEQDSYLCGLFVSVGRSDKVALAKGPKIEVMFEVDYDIVKLTSTIMSKMVCANK